MRGTMLWFNETKDVGLIASETGERFTVTGDHFSNGGRPPLGRVSGLEVEFRIAGNGEDRRAEHVSLVEESIPRRARRRGRG
jgi:cold shock CspA family protein